MRSSSLLTAVFGILLVCVTAAAIASVTAESKPESEPKHEADAAARELEKALTLTPDPENGREIFLMCAVCHQSL